MSNCRKMCHTDLGAPPLYGYKRGALYEFLDTVFLTGYNQKFILKYSRLERVVTINYAAPHGYVIGQLLNIKGSSYPAFNRNYRVTEIPTTNSLKIYIKDDAFASYPEESTEPSLESKVAPLDWELLYSSTTQRSYRSRSVKSSKIVVTFKQSTYKEPVFVTTGAHCYEMDLSKDIDKVTGSTIDSCFVTQKQTTGHSNHYFIVSTNGDNLESMPSSWTNDVHRTPWTIVGDESMVYFMNCPYTDGVYENGNYRQYNLDWSSGSYRFTKMTAFGDILPYDETEYQTGSSFYFHFYMFTNPSSSAGSMTNPVFNPFNKGGNISWYDYFFANYDPTGSYGSARISTMPPLNTGSYGGATGSSENYVAYPQRIIGGLTYFDYLAYANNTSGTNNAGLFLKGIFKYSKYSDINLNNVGNSRTICNMVLDQDQPYKKLFFSNNHGDYWSYNSYHGCYLFELD